MLYLQCIFIHIEKYRKIFEKHDAKRQISLPNVHLCRIIQPKSIFFQTVLGSGGEKNESEMETFLTECDTRDGRPGTKKIWKFELQRVYCINFGAFWCHFWPNCWVFSNSESWSSCTARRSHWELSLDICWRWFLEPRRDGLRTVLPPFLDVTILICKSENEIWIITNLRKS